MLQFPNSWRFSSPEQVPSEVLSFISSLVLTIARGQQNIIECFKNHFASASGSTSSRSSNLSWAESDLQGYMQDASKNAPLFIEAFYDACEYLKEYHPELPVPELYLVNQNLSEHTKYKIVPPDLIVSAGYTTEMPSALPKSLDEKAQEIIQQSISESARLLSEKRYRPAVQELLWLLETVSTAFQGAVDSENRIIEGKYFNKIIGDLRKKNKGRSLEQILTWITTLHGYLSAPAGGGVRHGLDLKEGVATTAGEALLFCNLIKSYISFLLSEHESMARISKRESEV